jgi:hypothetical protein
MEEKKSFAEMYMEEKEELEKENSQLEENSIDIVDTIEKLKEEIEKYNRNEVANFSNVKWEELVKDKDFTEDMVIMFQMQIQLYYDEYIKTHNVSDGLIRKMYYEFTGHFNPDMLDENTRNRIFPELKENKE